MHRSAPCVGLGKFYRIDGVGGGDNGNQLGDSQRGRCRFRFPIRLPPGGFPNILIRFFVLLPTRNVTAQITNESYS
ncbi:MAG: hypothetical protein ACJ8DI_23765 [Ktedonobacteraceae bacterium]